MIGTTNEEQFLRDLTGNRRFWPVAVDEFDLTALRRDRDQLWAEAALVEAQGGSIRMDPRLWGDAEAAQRRRLIVDPWVELVREAMTNDDGEPINGKIRSADAWEIVGVPPDRRTQDHNYRLGQAMRVNGWTPCQRRFDGKRQSAYVCGNEVERHTVVAYRDPNGGLIIRIEEG